MTEVNNDEFNVPAPLPVVRQRLIDEGVQHGYNPYATDDIPDEVLLESIRLEQDRLKMIENEKIVNEQLRLLQVSQRQEMERRMTEREEKYQRILRKITNLMKFVSGDVSDLLFVESIIRQYIRHISDILFISYSDHQRFTNLILKNFREAEYGDIFTVIRKIPSSLSLKQDEEDEVDAEAEVYEYEGEEY